MAKSKKVKKVKVSKKVSKLGIIKFLVLALILVAGLIYGIQMVQKSQETRSSAAAKQTCKCSKSKYGDAYNCFKNKGTWKCTSVPVKPTVAPTKKPTAVPTKKLTVTPTVNPMLMPGSCIGSIYSEMINLSNGQSKCVNTPKGSSEMINCKNGKLSVVATYTLSNCWGW